MKISNRVRRNIPFSLTIIFLLSICPVYAGEKKEDNFEFSNKRGSMSGMLTSSDAWQLEVGYHYMLNRYFGFGGSLGMWKVYFEEGRAYGDDWKVDWEYNKPENFYLHPSLILKTPGVSIKKVDLGLYAEPGVVLCVPYAQVWVEQKINRNMYESKRVWTSGGQWFAADLRAGAYLNYESWGISAGYMMSSLDVYSQYRALAYKGTSFRKFYPRKPFMQGAYIVILFLKYFGAG